MSLENAEKFTQAVAQNPALLAEVNAAASSKSLDEAAAAIAAIGKREGYDFTATEGAHTRGAALQALSENDLNKVAGGATDPVIEQTLNQAGNLLGGRVVPGGGIIGAGVGTGVATAIGGGSASESVTAGAMASAQSLNDTKSIVQQVFSGW